MDKCCPEVQAYVNQEDKVSYDVQAHPAFLGDWFCCQVCGIEGYFYWQDDQGHHQGHHHNHVPTPSADTQMYQQGYLFQSNMVWRTWDLSNQLLWKHKIILGYSTCTSKRNYGKIVSGPKIKQERKTVMASSYHSFKPHKPKCVLKCVSELLVFEFLDFDVVHEKIYSEQWSQFYSYW